MRWLFWELLFSMLCMFCMDKRMLPKLDLMISGNYVVIMIMLIFTCIYMYVCHCLIRCSGIMIIYI